jgi:hypothetical protein
VGKTRLAREALAAADAAGCETKWAVASRAVAAIPFGAVADLLPPAEEKSTHLQLLQQAGQWLVERAGGRRVVLGIDDALGSPPTWLRWPAATSIRSGAPGSRAAVS